MGLLGGSWVVINGVISRVTIHIRGLITPLIATHKPPGESLKGTLNPYNPITPLITAREPPSRDSALGFGV